MKSKHKHKTNFIIFYVLSIIIFFTIVAMVISYSGVFDKKKIHEVTIKDECSLIMSNLIHEIGSESNCKLNCETECAFIDKKIYNFSFVASNNSCNSCFCNCID